MKNCTIAYVFVDAIPEVLEEHTLYVAMNFATAAHKCICGCGQEVITPLSPTDWKISYDGVSVSLSPSIGNWSFDCQSHYWIVRNEIRWAEKWTRVQIAAGRAADKSTKHGHANPRGAPSHPPRGSESPGLLFRIRRWFSNL